MGVESQGGGCGMSRGGGKCLGRTGKCLGGGKCIRCGKSIWSGIVSRLTMGVGSV